MEIPLPAVLWRRWAALATALSAVGFDDVWTVGERGAHHDDHGGNWAHLVLIDGGRAVLYGYDHEYSATVDADPPVDVLAGAPEWLPWDELEQQASEDQLGYVHWHDGTAWGCAPYDEADGLAQTAGPVLDHAAAAGELYDFVVQWADLEPADDADEARIRAAGEALLDAAERQSVDESVLRAYPGGRLIEAGLAVAAAGGISPGGTLPVILAGQRPPRRRVRRLSDREHRRLVWDAMQRATELDRPLPPPTPAMDDLVRWVRGRAPQGDGRCSLLFWASASGASEEDGEFPPRVGEDEDSLTVFSSAVDLVHAVRADEADPRAGAWLFLRVETTATGAAIDRRYDSWPDWWLDNGISGPGRDELAEEMAGRAEPWRPRWTALLDSEVAFGD
ncbi:hypothetical protein [Actinoplanes sp. NPDC049265]|uniref:hypothetical protein n=1 Tax=Actinoplanes sp. NPDC049265 TaxID=3363902 RepID=UPI0037178CB7